MAQSCPVMTEGQYSRPADGQVLIISHDTEEEAFSCAQGKEEAEMSEASRERYGLCFGKKINQHVGDCAGHIPDLQEGEVGQEHDIRV